MNARAWRLVVSLLLVSLLLWGAGALVGSTGAMAPTEWAHDPVARQIMLDIRLPRSAGAWLAGALLALAGAVAQGLFRNPLADPFLLGSASGASLGVALAFWAWGSAAALGAGTGTTIAPWLLRLGLTGTAFAGALAGVMLSLLLARGAQNTLRLLLAGVIVGYVTGALRELVTLGAPEVLTALQSFSLGGAGLLGWSACALMAAVLVPCVAVGWSLARVLDGLSLGDATAHSLGLPLVPARLALIAVLALATGTAVAQAGLVAFVGLAAPHLVRAHVPGTHGPRVLLSALAGGVLLLAADLLARSLLAPQELPVGVLTAALGGGYLLLLLHRRARMGVA